MAIITHAADTLWTIVVQCIEQISNHGHNNTHAADTVNDSSAV